MSYIDIIGAEQFSWWREFCPLCSSVNYIFIDNLSIDAWKCWNCQNNWWIDDLTPTSYCMLNNKDLEEAEADLREGLEPIILIDGQMEQ